MIEFIVSDTFKFCCTNIIIASLAVCFCSLAVASVVSLVKSFWE